MALLRNKPVRNTCLYIIIFLLSGEKTISSSTKYTFFTSRGQINSKEIQIIKNIPTSRCSHKHIDFQQKRSVSVTEVLIKGEGGNGDGYES